MALDDAVPFTLRPGGRAADSIDRMNEPTDPDLGTGLGRAWKAALREALFLLLAGCIFALLANQLSPRGLSLSRNYFPASPDRKSVV